MYALWDRLGIHPNPTRGLSLQDAAETAAATAKHLFDHYYKRHGDARRRHSVSSGSEYMTGTSHHSKGSRHHRRRQSSHHSNSNSHSRSHSHARTRHPSHRPSHHTPHHRQLSDMAMAASLEHSREREGAYAPQLAAPGMVGPGMIGAGMAHRPPGMGGGPMMGGGVGMPGMGGMMGAGMGMNPSMMSPGMMGMNPGMMNPGMMNPMMVRFNSTPLPIFAHSGVLGTRDDVPANDADEPRFRRRRSDRVSGTQRSDVSRCRRGTDDGESNDGESSSDAWPSGAGESRSIQGDTMLIDRHAGHEPGIRASDGRRRAGAGYEAVY